MTKWYEGTGGSGEQMEEVVKGKKKLIITTRKHGRTYNPFKDIKEKPAAKFDAVVEMTQKKVGRKKLLTVKEARRLLAPSHSDLVHAVLDYLNKTKKFAWKQKTMGVKDQKNGRTFYRKDPKQRLGVPDIFCVYKGRAIGIEVKAGDDRLSVNQKLFNEGLNEAGGFYLLARDLETVERFFKWFDKYGKAGNGINENL
jgi:hypothetical protein